MLFNEDNSKPTAANSDTEEIASLKEIITKLRQKYKQAQIEIQDLNKEHSDNKQELMDIIRFQEKDMKFSERLIQIMLNENELYKVR